MASAEIDYDCILKIGMCGVDQIFYTNNFFHSNYRYYLKKMYGKYKIIPNNNIGYNFLVTSIQKYSPNIDLVEFIKETNGCIAGSFTLSNVLKCHGLDLFENNKNKWTIYDYSDIKHKNSYASTKYYCQTFSKWGHLGNGNDIDIYITQDYEDIVYKYFNKNNVILEKCTDRYTSKQTVYDTLCCNILSDDNVKKNEYITKVYTYTSDNFNLPYNGKVDIIILNNSIKINDNVFCRWFIEHEFDLSICKCIYTKHNLMIKNFKDLVEYKGILEIRPVVYYKNEEELEKWLLYESNIRNKLLAHDNLDQLGILFRVWKYQNRQFDIDTSNFKITMIKK